MRYMQLTQEERYQISAILQTGYDQTGIAMILGRHKSTISHEIRRNTGLRGYQSKQAQRLTYERRQAKVRTYIHEDTWLAVEQLINWDWSPEQISLWLKTFCAILINHAMDKLNNRPRKWLGLKTPNQVLLGINPPVALVS